MKEIIDKAQEYLKFVFVRSVAHENSAEWHRSMGAHWGIVSTALSAIVGSALFVTISDKFGYNGGNSFTFSFANWSQGWRILAYVITGLVLVLSPVLTSIQAFLNQPQQAEKHKASCAKYLGLKNKLDLFIIRYQNENRTSENVEKALNELRTIAEDIPIIISEGITLTKKALNEAKKSTKKSDDTNQKIAKE